MGRCNTDGEKIIKAIGNTKNRKMGEVMKKVFFILMVPVYIALAIPPLSADDVSAQTCEKMIARVVSVQGDVQVKKAGETQWLPVNRMTCIVRET